MTLIMVLVMSMGIMAWAEDDSSTTTTTGTSSTDDAGTGSITVENAASKGTYVAYKIFDVTYADNTGTAYAYTIDSTSAWMS